MGLFSKKTKPVEDKAPELRTFSFVLKDHFRGYKRFPISIYGDPEAVQNNEMLSGDLSGRSIKFVEAISDAFTEPKHYYIIYLDDIKVGHLFDDEQIEKLNNNQILEVYARIEEKEYLNKKKKTETEKRIKLFVKYSEQ